MPRAASWQHVCATLNNPKPEEEQALREAVTRAGLKYVVYQRESGEEKTEHLQVYAEAAKRLSIAEWKLKLGSNRYHLERRMGSQKSARDYCMKEDTRLAGPWEFGVYTESAQGKRSDLEALATAAVSGKRLRDLLEDEDIKPSTLLLHLNHFQKLREALSMERDSSLPMEVVVLTGPTGCGKTRWAREHYPGAYWTPPGPLKWWDKYEGQETIVIDEFDWEKVDYRVLLRVLDRYGPQVETKGGFTTLRHNRVILTSALHPDAWYENVANVSELRRRITKIGTVKPPASAGNPSDSYIVEWM